MKGDTGVPMFWQGAMTISAPGSADLPLPTSPTPPSCPIHNTLLVKISMESLFHRGKSPHPASLIPTILNKSLPAQPACSSLPPNGLTLSLTSPPLPLQLLHPVMPFPVCPSKSSRLPSPCFGKRLVTFLKGFARTDMISSK